MSSSVVSGLCHLEDILISGLTVEPIGIQELKWLFYNTRLGLHVDVRKMSERQTKAGNQKCFKKSLINFDFHSLIHSISTC